LRPGYAFGFYAEDLMYWMKRVGVIGFAFFFLKGLAWLALAAVTAWSAAR
jgi:hypothetical protein